MNAKFQNALNLTEQKVPPIWFMRQAGRYHKHYQGLRAKYGFKQLCLEPELAAQVALGPIEDFDFDVSILFSDILFPLEALGIPLEYQPGPKLGFELNESALSRLGDVDSALEYMQFQKSAVRLTREMLPESKSLIGFVGGPFTLFSYAVQGSHQGGLIQTKKNMGLFSSFGEKMVPLLIENIKLQAEAGAEVVMIFDTAAGEVSPQIFNQLIVPCLDKIVEKTRPIKLGYYAKGVNPHYYGSVNGFCGKGYDHHWRIDEELKKEDKSGFVQGNFDQALLHLAKAEFEEQLKIWMQPILELPVSQRAGWVCGLGHGVLPATPEENVRIFVETVRREFGR